MYVLWLSIINKNCGGVSIFTVSGEDVTLLQTFFSVYANIFEWKLLHTNITLLVLQPVMNLFKKLN